MANGEQAADTPAAVRVWRAEQTPVPAGESAARMTRRALLLGGIAATALATPLAALARNNRDKTEDYIIPPEAMPIFAGSSPELRRVIDMMNRGLSKDMIMAALYPTQTYTSTDGTFVVLPQVPAEEAQTPQWWIVNKAFSVKYNDSYLYTSTLHAKRGVPPIRDKGVAYFAHSMHPKNPHPEHDLYKALYLAATGDEALAQPLIDGTYITLPEIQKTAERWMSENKFDYLNNKDKMLLAYLASTLKEKKFVNPNLVSCVNMLLSGYYNNINDNGKCEIFSAIIPNSFEGKKMPKFRVVGTHGKYYPISPDISPTKRAKP